MFDPRETKVNAEPIEQKNFQAPHNLSFTEFLVSGGNGDLGAFSAIQLYVRTMPIRNAVDMRAQAYSQIPIRVQDTKTGEFLEDHPSLELLKKPNADVSQMEFLEKLAMFYDITGENFIIATGDVNREPLELINASPKNVSFGTGLNRFELLNVPSTIWLTNTNSSIFLFNAVENQEGIRFYNAPQDKELWQMRRTNPLGSTSNFRGLSPAGAIWNEAEQYNSGNTTQLSMLKRGTRLSMAWINARSEALTDTQWDRMKEQAQMYAGDKNAGGVPILDGMDVKPIQQTNRDMEFEKLQRAMFERISIIYKIPLALLLSESMTLNNLETAELQFFDNAVLPLADRLNDELTRFLMPRYKNSENLRFTYNENDITALRLRMIETAKALSEINVNTVNEVRKVIGDDEIDGGDVVLRPATLIPLGMESFGDEIDDLAEETLKGVSSKFKQMLREKNFTEDQIETAAKQAGL